MSQPTVFISYSHKDESKKDRLLSHLGVLQDAGGLIDLWSDDRIGAGEDWEQKINEAIAKAKVAILLVSANFLTSNFILTKEVPKLLERRESGDLTVFPVIAEPCAWQTVDWLSKMNVRPKNGKPVWSDRGSHVDEDLSAIAEEVADIIKKARNAQATASPIPSPTPDTTWKTSLFTLPEICRILVSVLANIQGMDKYDVRSDLLETGFSLAEKSGLDRFDDMLTDLNKIVNYAATLRKLDVLIDNVKGRSQSPESLNKLEKIKQEYLNLKSN